jgi:hypothetical protein
VVGQTEDLPSICPVQNEVRSGTLVGESTLVDVVIKELDGASVQSLLDTGSQISTICKSLYDRLAGTVSLQSLDTLEIIVGGGHTLPYLGVVTLDLIFPMQVGDFELTALFLVVEDSAANAEVPMLLGTNVLRCCYEVCKQQSKEGWEQSIPVSWQFAFLCLEMANYNDQIDTVVKCQSAILVPPMGTADFNVWGVKPQEGEKILFSDDDVSLPGGVVVTPMVISGEQNEPITVTLNNICDTAVLIPRGTEVCHAESVQMMTQVSPPSETASGDVQFLDLFDLEKTKENCTETGQYEKVQKLLHDHKNAFSLNDFDMGKAKGVTHEINLTDTRPFRERYRRIPPSMLQEVRDHISMMLDAGIVKPSESP